MTVLTSINAAALATIGVGGTPAEQVPRLARLALDAGADWIVVDRPITGAADPGAAAAAIAAEIEMKVA